MVSQKVRVKNPSGLHLRPAGVLCSTALQFKCRVRFTFREATVNAKSVLSVLGACVKEGDEITFECEGEDEDHDGKGCGRRTWRRTEKLRSSGNVHENPPGCFE